MYVCIYAFILFIHLFLSCWEISQNFVKIQCSMYISMKSSKNLAYRAPGIVCRYDYVCRVDNSQKQTSRNAAFYLVLRVQMARATTFIRAYMRSISSQIRIHVRKRSIYIMLVVWMRDYTSIFARHAAFQVSTNITR